MRRLSNYFEIDNNGLLTFKPGSVGLQQLVVYNVTGQFKKADYPGVRRVWVRCVGGGGGAAGAKSDGAWGIASPSASGGSYSESILDAASLAATEAVVVGAGGAGSLGNVNGAGGGTSSFGGFLSAPGGNGSAPLMPQGTNDYAVPGPPPGAVGTGQLGLQGSPGGGAMRFGNGAIAWSQPGGNSGGGYGAGGNGRVAEGQGIDATAYGGGGGGAVSAGTEFRGGNGAQGGVFVIVFY